MCCLQNLTEYNTIIQIKENLGLAYKKAFYDGSVGPAGDFDTITASQTYKKIKYSF